MITVESYHRQVCSRVLRIRVQFVLFTAIKFATRFPKLFDRANVPL